MSSGTFTSSSKQSAARPGAIRPVMCDRCAASAPPALAMRSQVHPAPIEKSPTAMPTVRRCAVSAASIRRKASPRVPSVPRPRRMPMLCICSAGATALPFQLLATGL